MRKLIAATLLSLAFCLAGFGQASRSVIQAINPSGMDQVILDLPGEVELLVAPGDLIQVETEIQLLNAGDPILKALIHAMRYSIVAEKKGGNLLIHQANRLAPVTVRGLEIEETYRFKVYLPNDMPVAIADPAALSIPMESAPAGTNSR